MSDNERPIHSRQQSAKIILLRPPITSPAHVAASLERLANETGTTLAEIVAMADAHGVELPPAVRHAAESLTGKLPAVEGRAEPPPALVQFAATLDALVTSQTMELDMLRRQFLRALGAAAGGTIVTGSLAPLADSGQSSKGGQPLEASARHDYVLKHPSGVDPVAVDFLRERVRQLNERYDQTPSTSLLPTAGQHFSQVMFLREHASDTRVRDELLGVEAQAATLMGQLVWDASQRRDHATANAYYDQAVSAARHTGDTAVEGYAFLRKSFVALYGERNPRLGGSLAQQATALTCNGTSHALAGLALLHVGEAFAMLGERRDCELALGGAESEFTRIQAADPARSLFCPDQVSRLKGSCYLFLRYPEKAGPILEAAARSLHDRQKSRAIVLGNLALAHIRQQNLEEAAAVLEQAIDVVEITRGGGVLNVLFTAGRELRPWQDHPIVRAVHDRLLGLVAA